MWFSVMSLSFVNIHYAARLRYAFSGGAVQIPVAGSRKVSRSLAH